MNEVFEVLTVRDLDFQDQQNRQVKGMQLWLIRPSDDKAWNGWEVTKVWIPDGHRLESDVAMLKRGDQIQISWDRRGKPVIIELVA